MMQLEVGGRRYPIGAGEMVVGSAPGCDLSLSGGDVRARHLVVDGRPSGRPSVRRGEAGAEARINGTALTDEPVTIQPGDRIEVAGHELVVRALAPEEPAVGPPLGAEQSLNLTLHGLPVEQLGLGASRPAPGLLASVLVRSGALKGQRLAVRRPAVVIGREGANDLVLPDPSVSARHATLQRREQVWILTDLDSTNGTFVDGERIAGEAPLGPGATVRFGDVAVLFDPLDDGIASTDEPRPASSAVRARRTPAPAAAKPPEGRRIGFWLLVVGLLAAAIAALTLLT